MTRTESRSNLPKIRSIVVVSGIGIHLALVAWGAYRHSPTMDETAYLVSGISHWQFGRFDLCKVSPPLVRLVAAVPVQLSGPEYNWNSYKIGPGIRAEHSVGREFAVANGRRSFWLFTLGRWACVPFSLIGAWVSYRWARELFGFPSALAALLLWCFSPNILAHAQQLTPDVGVTALSLAACYAVWNWSRSPTKLRACLAGAVLGTAVLAKTNAVALYPALACGVVLRTIVSKRSELRVVLWHLCIGFLTSIYVINVGYGFEGTLKPLGQYEFFSGTFTGDESHNRFRGTFLEKVPVPLPSAFLEGIDLQRRDFENRKGTMQTYFRGQWYDHGWWWYYLYAAAVKVPVGTWIMGILGCLVILFHNSLPRLDCFCFVILPGAMLFAIASSQTGFGHSLRYVVPAFPFAFVLASASVSREAKSRVKAISMLALAWTIGSSLYVYPHSLSYFNELSGGPQNGHFHLLDGNVDWGQDYFYAREWIENHPDCTPVYLAFWGPLPLKQLGEEYQEPKLAADQPIPPGWYLISVNHLRNEYRFGKAELERFLELTPAERITYAIYLYHIPASLPDRALMAVPEE